MPDFLSWILLGAFIFAPFTTGGEAGSYTVTPAAFLLAIGSVLTFIRRLALRRPLVPSVIWTCWPVPVGLAYMFAGLLSGFHAADQAHFWRDVLQRTLILLAPMYAISMGLKKLEDAERILLAFLPVGTLISVIAVSTAIKLGFAKPAIILDLHKNSLGATCTIGALISLAFLIAKNTKGKVWLFRAAFVISFVGVIASQSRAALISFLGGMLMMFLCAKFRRRVIVGWFAGIVSVITGIVLLLPKEAIESVTSFRKHSSNDERLTIWVETFNWLKDHPMGGLGWGNVIVINGYGFLDVANAYLQEWVQGGIFGLVCFVALAFVCLRLAFSNASRIPKNGLLASVNLAAAGVVAARFIHAFFDVFWVGRGPTLTTFVAVGMLMFVKLLLDQNETLARVSPRMFGAQPQQLPSTAS